MSVDMAAARVELRALQEATERLIREVYYFDDHSPDECAIIRWADFVNDLLPTDLRNERQALRP